MGHRKQLYERGERSGSPTVTDPLGRLLLVTLEAARLNADLPVLGAIRSWLDPADPSAAASGTTEAVEERGKRIYGFTGQGSYTAILPGDLATPNVVTPAGFEPAISTLKGSRPGPG